MVKDALDRDRLDALLVDLEMGAFRPGQAPYQGMQDHGQFIEEVHTALGQCLGFDCTKVQIRDWHLEMRKHGFDCHPARFGAIDVIYGYRNIASHPNEEKHLINLEEVKRRFDDIHQLIPELDSRLVSHPLVDYLFKVQACSLHQRRAESLRLVIAGYANPNDLIPIVLDYALPFIPESKRGFQKAPLDRQLAPILVILGRVCSTSESDPLTGLAEHILRHATPAMSLNPLHHWSAKFGHPLMPGTSPLRLRVIRLTMDRDPRDARTILVRHASIVEPPVPDQDQYLPEFPIPCADLGELYNLVIGLMKKLRPALAQWAAFESGAREARHWREFILA
jgi:hypothetical protein